MLKLNNMKIKTISNPLIMYIELLFYTHYKYQKNEKEK